MLTPFAVTLKFKNVDMKLDVLPGRLALSGSFASDFIDITPPVFLSLQEVKELYAMLIIIMEEGGQILQLPIPKEES